MPFYRQSAMSQGACPNSYPSATFIFEFAVKSIKEFGGASNTIFYNEFYVHIVV
jgi:hypothetical protein